MSEDNKNNNNDENKKDLGPFDDEFFDDDLDNDAGFPGEDDSDDDFVGFEEGGDNEDDDFADDKPAVSITKKKNIILIVVIALVALYFVTEFMTSESDKIKPVAQNEAEEMSEEFREKAEVPALKANFNPDTQKIQKRDDSNSINDLIVAPPPPPLIESSSQFTSGSSSGLNLPPIGNDQGSASSGSNDRRSLISYLGSNNRSRGGSAPNLPSLGSGSGGGVFAGGGGSSSGSFRGGSGAVVSQDYRARIQAPMFLMQNSDTEFVLEQKQRADLGNGGYPIRDFTLGNSPADNSDATFVGNLKNVIIQGKVIDAVIETAINTDLPDGILRGIVSRDVYAERGNRILIPKGSRLIGSYSTDVKFGQARVFIIWNRVVRPDGIDAFLDSQATDLLGRNGVYGQLDNRFFEIFGSSILLSSITIAFAVAATELADPPQAQSSAVAGQVVEDTDPLNDALTNEVANLGGSIQGIAQELLEQKPRVTVDQGTKIKIFVNKDIHFPDSFKSDEDTVKIIK